MSKKPEDPAVQAARIDAKKDVKVAAMYVSGGLLATPAGQHLITTGVQIISSQFEVDGSDGFKADLDHPS